MPKAREMPLCPYWGVENEIIVFLINEGLNENVAMATKYLIFWISSHLVS